jgi:hypothetical protein
MMPQLQLTRPQSIPDLAARLIGLGYHPVPIDRGNKYPTISGWQNLRLTAEDVPSYFTPLSLVGLLHINVACFDIDVYDPDLANEIAAEGFRRFPGALERIGEAPKTMLVMRLDAPGWRIHQTQKATRGDLTGQVDVRTVTRQFVAYGPHPATGQPYRWPRGELWATPQADLPALERDAAEDYRDWCADRLRQWGDKAPAAVIDIGEWRSAPAGIATDERPTEAHFLEALSHVPADLGHDAGWLSGLMAIHDFFGGSARGLDAAKDWSSADRRYNAREVETKWRSFEVGRGVSYKSVFHLAKQNGADLSDMARRHRPEPQPLRIDTGADYTTTGAAPETAQAATQASALEWFDDIEPSLSDAYLVKDMLAAGAMSVIYGPSNSGKTFKAMDIAFHLAAGLPWRGRRVTQAAVLYLAAEGGRGVANRIAALKRHTGARGIPFALRRAGFDLLRSEADLQHIYTLAREVQERAPGAPLLIVIDTLSRVMAGGDENAPADMTALIKNMDTIREATGAHIMLVHHTGKDAAKGARGHSSLRAATDTEIEVQVEGDSRAALITKQRDYQGGEVFAFALQSVTLGIDQDGDDVTSCVVVEAEAEEFVAAKKKPGKNQKALLETFDQMLGEGMWRPNPGGLGMAEPGHFKAVQMDDFRAACEGRLVAKNTRSAFLTAFDSLLGPNGPFVLASGLVWRTDRKVN